MEDVVPMEVTEVTNLVRDKGHPKYRGLAIIVIFHKFHRTQGLDDISFTEEDRELLKIGFSKLQYGVVVWDEANMTRKLFLDLLEKVSHDPINNECETFALVIITHGNRNGILHAFDGPFCRQDVYDCFKAEKCDGLKDKMKFFIFHACRGDKFGEGVQADGRTTSRTFGTDKLKDRLEINHLILCSTFEGHYALGPEMGKGSLFIRKLCSVMEEEASKDECVRKHILALLTDVIRKTANEDIHVKGEIKKQQPALIMTLLYLYHFMNKDEIPSECLQRLSLPILLKRE